MISVLPGSGLSRAAASAGLALSVIAALTPGTAARAANGPVVNGTAASGPAASEAPKAGCDAVCARQAVPAAVQACAPGIERQAPTDFEWMNRPTGTIFQQAVPPAGSETVVKFRGDSIRFLSPQSQWVRITYECDYDTATQAVRSVKVQLGRIDGKGANVGASALPRGGAPAVAQAGGQPQAPAQPKRILPAEPSDVEIRQVPSTPRR